MDHKVISKFPTQWFKNTADRESIENTLLHSAAIKRLKELINGRLEELETKEVSPETYKDQSWSHLQAHLNGRKQELYFLLKLLDQGD